MNKLGAIVLAGVLFPWTAASGKGIPDIPAGVQNKAEAIVSGLAGHDGRRTGGWTRLDTTTPSDEDRRIFARAAAADEMHAACTPAALEATQVVTGINYLFLCACTQEGRTSYRMVRIYRDLKDNAEITDSVEIGRKGD